MDKEDCVGRDFLLGRHKITIEELEKWLTGIKEILSSRPEFHHPYIQWSNSDDDPFIYIIALRPETEVEISIREGQEKHQEKEDRKRFEYLKQKYSW